MQRPTGIGSFALLLFCALAPSASQADAFSGKLTDANGVALADARVVYQCNGRKAKSGAETLLKFSIVSASDGTFTFHDFPVNVSPKRPVTFGVQLPNGHLSTAIFRTRGATARVRDRRASALFQVVDDHGKGIDNAEIVLNGVAVLSSDGSGFFMQQGEFARPRRFKTGPGGSLRVPDLPADLDIYYQCNSMGSPETTNDFVTTVDRPSKIHLTLVQGVTLRGRVTHHGKPVPGATLQAASDTLENNSWVEKWVDAKTDRQGAYSVVAYAGSIKLTARIPGSTALFGTPLSAGRAAAGTEIDGLNVSLVDVIKVTGRVLEEGTEKPIKDARVEGVFGQVSQTKTTDADGTFTMIVPPGPAQIRIQHIGATALSFPYPTLNATIETNHNPPLKFFIAHTALLPLIRGLEGVVKDARGQPVADARVGIVTEQTETNTDVQGRFKFDVLLHPGSKLYAVCGGLATSAGIVLLDQHHLDITLDAPSAEFSGNVVDDTGRPVMDAAITLHSVLDNSLIFSIDHTLSDSDGRFRFSGVFPGMPSYAVEVKKPGYGGVLRDNLEIDAGHRLEVKDLQISRADASISGKVLDSDGHSAGGIAVMCNGIGAITDRYGAFHLTNVPRGDDWLRAVGSDGENGATGARGGQTDVVIRMQKSAHAPSTAYDDMRGQTAGALVAGEWLNASHIDLSNLKGKIVVIDLWAVWCGPCVRALPEVESLYHKYRANGVEVIGIHVTGTPLEQARKFVKQKGLTYPVFMDTINGANAATFPAKGIPQLYVVSWAGKIVCDTHDVTEAAAAVDAELKKR